MSFFWRQRREAQLRALSRSNPARVIGMFRAISGLDELCELPRHVSFTSMIEVILNREEEVATNEPSSQRGREP